MIKVFNTTIDLTNPIRTKTTQDDEEKTVSLNFYISKTPLPLEVKNWSNTAPKILCTTGDAVVYQTSAYAVVPVIYPVFYVKKTVDKKLGTTFWGWASTQKHDKTQDKYFSSMRAVWENFSLTPLGNMTEAISSTTTPVRNWYLATSSEWGLPDESTLNEAGNYGELVSGFFPNNGSNVSRLELELPSEDGSKTNVDVWNYLGIGGFKTLTEIEEDYENRCKNILVGTTVNTGESGAEATASCTFRFPIPENGILQTNWFTWGFPNPRQYYLCLDYNCINRSSYTPDYNFNLEGCAIVAMKVVKI